MRSSSRVLGLLLLGTLTLSGCAAGIPEKPASEKSSAPSADGTVEAADGERITGKGYAYRAPEGWGSHAYPGSPKPDTFMIDKGDADGFTDNFNVIPSPAGRLSVEQVETLGAAEFEAQPDAEVTVNDRVEVAGEESAHFTVKMKSDGASYVIEQFYPTSESSTYVATFTFSDTVPQAERMQIAESTLASWEWR